jgi:hypothetical protein
MNRVLGLTVAIVMPLTLATASRGQSISYGVETASPVYGVSAAVGQPYGGFGLQYSPEVPVSGMVVDQYGLLHPVASVDSAPPVVVQAQPRVMTRYRSRRPTAQPRYLVPTGSLGWSAGNGGMLYPVNSRYAAYGSGYGVGPYGVVDHQMMWKW